MPNKFKEGDVVYYKYKDNHYVKNNQFITIKAIITNVMKSYDNSYFYELDKMKYNIFSEKNLKTKEEIQKDFDNYIINLETPF